MDQEEQLLKIGTFSTLSRISIRMLRHYHEHGVLSPAVIDPFNGHRFYRADQLMQAHLVVQLREAGFAVEKIAQLAQSSDPVQVAAAITQQREMLSAERERLHERLAALDLVSITLKGRPEMTDVTLTTLPAMHLASLRETLPSYGDEGTLWEEMWPLLQQSGVAFPAGGISGATFHDPEFRESDVDVEVWIQVDGPFTPIAPLEYRAVAPQKVVSATLLGDYSQMPAVTGAIGAYIAEHALSTGPMFNIYRVSPAQNPDPSSWVTEVCFPVLAD
ncbi:MerR family transcriptional regulator [Leucobacter insecticola]|uniref:MerR family transcriptional regulator n=1 Tax=Leucobacter insecticola TaxID=2714934 RepID=A0A6G8FGV7_9MICO|nr:MerR family transcriptional regulator [Leucobacter insecticola]QIM15611.1 MerR family transcriptional regulator [Leucobacter insecticola]